MKTLLLTLISILFVPNLLLSQVTTLNGEHEIEISGDPGNESTILTLQNSTDLFESGSILRFKGLGSDWECDLVHKFNEWGSGSGGAFLVRLGGKEEFSITNGVVRIGIDHDKGTGFGGTIPNTKLAVKGTIRTDEVVVSLWPSNWPDYVFDGDYELMPLDELSDFITDNGHLPGFKPAEEMEETGVISVNEMQLKLLEKIEELTLYMIELKKENLQLKASVESLQEK